MTLDVTPQVNQREPTTVSHTHYCVVGDVSVDASAAIAPGVVLQALPGSRIVVGRGACLAGGVCVQSKSGLLSISSGATLGANVLVVGSGKIGANACISPGSTVMNPQVADDALLPPNTLSDTTPKKPTASNGYASPKAYSYSDSRSSFNSNSFDRNGTSQSSVSPNSSTQPLPKNTFVEPGPVEARPIQIPSIAVSTPTSAYDPSKRFSSNGFNQSSANQNLSTQPLPNNTFVEPGPVEPKPVQIPSIDVSAPAATFDPSRNGVQLNQQYDLSNGSSNQSSALTAPSHDRVYGRDQVSELISTLFPNRQSLNGN